MKHERPSQQWVNSEAKEEKNSLVDLNNTGGWHTHPKDLHEVIIQTDLQIQSSEQPPNMEGYIMPLCPIRHIHEKINIRTTFMLGHCLLFRYTEQGKILIRSTIIKH
jgi:hypothetical protein